jgi:hypothetical protein
MTVRDGRKALIELFGGKDFMFPIFIDECSFSKSSRCQEAPYFMLLRSIIRSILCNPVFMGTNAEAANFLGQALEFKSRSGYETPWCLVWHQLPRMSYSYLRKEKELLEEKLEPWRQRSSRNFLSRNFVEHFFKNMAFE